MLTRFAALAVAILAVSCAAPGPPSETGLRADSASNEADGSVEASSSPEIAAGVVFGFESDEAATLLAIALEFEPTRPVHEGRDYRVAEIGVRDGAPYLSREVYALVVIEFIDPIPRAESKWPDEATCDIGRLSEDFTGVAWLVSPTTGQVEAYSPQWDYEIQCVAVNRR